MLGVGDHAPASISYNCMSSVALGSSCMFACTEYCAWQHLAHIRISGIGTINGRAFGCMPNEINSAPARIACKSRSFQHFLENYFLSLTSAMTAPHPPRKLVLSPTAILRVRNTKPYMHLLPANLFSCTHNATASSGVAQEDARKPGMCEVAEKNERK